ncbi:MAG: tetratricopeptide repeat protein, partial [Chloroflexi bacterium]|nr:tetratricopeptide repeat protein [Chloroflexota bacterium]
EKKANAHVAIGHLYEDQGNIEGAANEYLTAIQSRPSYREARYFLAITYEKLGKNAEAIQQWEAYLAMGPAKRQARIAIEHLQNLRAALGITP